MLVASGGKRFRFRVENVFNLLLVFHLNCVPFVVEQLAPLRVFYVSLIPLSRLYVAVAEHVNLKEVCLPT